MSTLLPGLIVKLNRSLLGTLELNPIQVQKWSFALEKTTDFELDLV